MHNKSVYNYSILNLLGYKSNRYVCVANELPHHNILINYGKKRMGTSYQHFFK